MTYTREQLEQVKTIDELRSLIWKRGLLLSVELQYAKRYEKARAQGEREVLQWIWDITGGDKIQAESGGQGDE